jgi:hypothetical protein
MTKGYIEQRIAICLIHQRNRARGLSMHQNPIVNVQATSVLCMVVDEHSVCKFCLVRSIYFFLYMFWTLPGSNSKTQIEQAIVTY